MKTIEFGRWYKEKFHWAISHSHPTLVQGLLWIFPGYGWIWIYPWYCFTAKKDVEQMKAGQPTNPGATTYNNLPPVVPGATIQYDRPPAIPGTTNDNVQSVKGASLFSKVQRGIESAFATAAAISEEFREPGRRAAEGRFAQFLVSGESILFVATGSMRNTQHMKTVGGQLVLTTDRMVYSRGRTRSQ